ncbi:MAG: TonB-dependent receptor [Pseudomonadota bacterium]
MKTNFRFNESMWRPLGRALLSGLAAFVLLATPVASNAQETASSVRGVVTDADGNAVAGATVTVRNEATGLTRSATTSSAGEYTIRNLQIGYDYSISATASGLAGQRREGLAINLGKTANEDFQLQAGGAMEEIVALGRRQATSQVATGPSATFGLEALELAPTVNRNIVDVLRTDSRIYVDESRGDINAVQCAGKNSRYNSLTVDGVRMNDSFGLNSNGYPTERMPFSYDAINQVAVELAPFDVEYGGFSACNINAVTKSGGNEFYGSAFYDYTSDSFRADELEGDSLNLADFDETRYGITFGGPIIRDNLFFFVAYEKLNGVNTFDRGPIGSGAIDEVSITQAELDEIERIAREVYQYDPGFIPQALDVEDEKILVKLDWNINDTQRLAYTFNYNDGFNWSQSDSGSRNIEYINHIYERGAELNSHSATLYSDWTDRFSTEIRYGFLDLDNRQNSIEDSGFGEIRIETGDVNVYIGGDDSRQSNDLAYDVTTIALKGKYDLDNHSLSFGYENESLNIFNLFIQHTQTEMRFSAQNSLGLSGIESFEALFADDIFYNNSPAHNPTDAAADWGYDVNSVYIQDEFQIGDNLTIVAGIRHDWYTTDDRPALNPEFLAEYGFGNDQNLDGEGLTQPRIGFTWDLSGDTTVHGGIGLYSGGNPNVWLSNMYSNDNTRQFGAAERDVDLVGMTYSGCEAGVPVGPGYCVPDLVYDQVSTGTGDNFEINYLDPNFKLPKEWKYAVGVKHVFSNEWVFGGDILFTQAKDSAMIMRGDFVQTGTRSDGYPIYDSPVMGSFKLTNSSRTANSTVISLGIEKEFENGWYVRAGYAHTDAEDVQPMTSSVAFSNFSNRAFFDPQEDVLSTSNYQIEHRFTAAARWRKEVWTNSELTLSFYGHANSGRPFSIATPLGPFDTDPMDGPVTPYPFQFFADENILAPGEARNAYTGSWWRKIDARASLSFPGFNEDHRGEVYLVVDNLTNLINDDWGVLYQHSFPRVIQAGDTESRIGDASQYEIRLGLQYDF